MPELAELARLIKAQLIGDPSAEVTRARPFDLAGEGDVTLASDARYVSRIPESRATAIIVSEPLVEANRNLLVASNPKLAFALAIHALHSRDYQPTGVSGDLIVGEGTRLGRELCIHSRVVVGRDAVIGDRVTLHPGAVIGDRCIVGDETVVHDFLKPGERHRHGRLDDR